MLVKPTPGKSVFGRRAKEEGIDGEVADKLNKLVQDPHASVDITLGKLPLTVSRTDTDTVAISGSVLGHKIELDGHFDVVKGKQAIVIAKIRPKAGSESLPLGYSIASLPNTIRISRSTSGRMVYSLDKPVVTNGTFGVRERHGAGFFHFER